MSEEEPKYLNLVEGMRILLIVDIPNVHYTSRGVVTSVSTHSFRVECETTAPTGTLQLGQEVRITPLDEVDVLPLVTRIVRVTPGALPLFVLQIPTSSWLTNRRAFFRATLALPVVLIRTDAPVAAGHTLNLSGGGLLLEADVFLEIREEFQIVIQFDEESIGCKARVMWARYEDGSPSLYGIMFTEIPRRDQNRLCRIVQLKEFEERRNEVKELTGRNADR